MKTFTTFLLLILSLSLFAQDKIHVHTATVDNISTQEPYLSTIDHPDLNNNPNAKVIVKQYFTGVFNDNPVGITYFSGPNRWTIVNENLEPIPPGAAFNVLIGDDAEFFVHVATPANQGAQGAANTKLDHPLLNDEDPGPLMFFSTNPLFNGNQALNPNQYGLWYSENRRQIYEQGNTAIPANAAFHVLIPNNGIRFNHVTSNENNSFNLTYINNPALNNNPIATFVFEHYWGVNAATQVIIDKNLGLFYDSNQGRWGIFTQDGSTMPLNLNFDILVVEEEVLSTESNDITVSLNIAPNPATDFVTIKSNAEIEAITIYNILGQQVISRKATSVLETQIDISQQPAGTYIVHVKTTTGTQTAKLIKD